MSNHTPGPKRRYPSELRERAVRMYFEAVDRAGGRHGVVTRVAQQLGIGAESLRNWIRQAEVDRGERRGTTTEGAQRMAELEREVCELRRANEILKAASVFFATELDGRRPR
jgi:transposase